jgi:predicted Zn-dependent protease
VNRFDLEREIVELALSENPEDADALYLAADLDIANGAVETGLAHLNKAVELEPRRFFSIVQKARGMYLSGDKDNAIQFLQALVKEDVDQYVANYYLSRFLALENRDLKRAQNLARQATTCGNNSLESMMNVCFVYLKAGRTDLMIGESRRARAVYFDYPEPYFYLGLGLYHEEREGAKARLEKAIELGLTGEHLDLARETLRSM